MLMIMIYVLIFAAGLIMEIINLSMMIAIEEQTEKEALAFGAENESQRQDRSEDDEGWSCTGKPGE